MKQGWEIKKLGDVCISLEDGDWIEKKNQSNDGVRLIQTGNIGCGIYKNKSDKAKYISNEVFTKLRCTEVVAGDILVSRLPEPVGRACIVPHLATKCITAVDCSIVKLNPNVILASWFIYYTQSADYIAKVMLECSGTTRDRISRKKLSVITVPVPSLAEQERIVRILDREFEKIDALKENAEKNLQHAKDLFQSALKQELQPKEGWATKTISEISENLDYRRVPVTKKDRSVGVYPYYGASGIVDYVDGFLFDENLLLVSEDGANLLARSTPIAFSVSGKIWVNNHAHILRFPNIELQRYVEYFFAGLDINEYVTGAAQPKFNQKALNSILITYPPKASEQQELIEHLDKLEENCRTLEENYTKTITLCDDMKQALLRKAFNGEL